MMMDVITSHAQSQLTPPFQCRIYGSLDWVSIDSGNGLSLILCQAITQTDADLVSIGPSREQSPVKL